MSDSTPSGDVLTSAVDKLPPIVRASRFGIVLLGTLYTAGLIIVNVDLARYGLVSVDLARAEYVMTGSLWAFVMITLLAAGDYLLLCAKAWLKRPVERKHVLYMGSAPSGSSHSRTDSAMPRQHSKNRSEGIS